MSSSLSIDQTETRVPPDGCLGVATETRSFDASARFAPLPRPRRAIGSWLLFHAQMSAHEGSAASEVSFDYAPNPEAPWVGPSTYAVAPEREDFRCFFDARATRRSGRAYALKPVEGRYRLIYRPLASMLDCGGISATFFGDYDVGLRVRVAEAEPDPEPEYEPASRTTPGETTGPGSPGRIAYGCAACEKRNSLEVTGAAGKSRPVPRNAASTTRQSVSSCSPRSA